MKDSEKIKKILDILNSEKVENEKIIDIFLSLFNIQIYETLNYPEQKEYEITVYCSHGSLNVIITKEQYDILNKWREERNNKHD